MHPQAFPSAAPRAPPALSTRFSSSRLLSVMPPAGLFIKPWYAPTPPPVSVPPRYPSPVRNVRFSLQLLRFIERSSSNRNSGESLRLYSALDMFGSNGPPSPVYGLYGWFAMAPRGATRPRSPAIAAGVANPDDTGSSIPLLIGASSDSTFTDELTSAAFFASERLPTPSKSRRPISAVRASAGRTRRVFSASVQRRASRDLRRASRTCTSTSTDSTSCRETKRCVSPCGVAKDGVLGRNRAAVLREVRAKATSRRGRRFRRSDLFQLGKLAAVSWSRFYDLFHRDRSLSIL